MMIIDEGWGNMDEERIKKIGILNEIFRKEYKYCILISHLEEIKSSVDSEISIKVDKNNYSKLIY